MIRLTGENHCRKDRVEAVLPWNDAAEPSFDSMDLFSAGLVLIDDNLQVLRANAAAREHLGPNGDGFARALGQSQGTHSQELRRQIREAILSDVRMTQGDAAADQFLRDVINEFNRRQASKRSGR